MLKLLFTHNNVKGSVVCVLVDTPEDFFLQITRFNVKYCYLYSNLMFYDVIGKVAT